MELQEYARAESICSQGLQAAGRDPAKRRGILYCLIDINLKQTGRAKECIGLISEIEKTFQGAITDKAYYDRLIEVLFWMLIRDKEKVDSNSADLIIVRMINEPLFYSKGNLCLSRIIHKILRGSPDICYLLQQRIQTIIQKDNINNPLGILVSSVSSDKERIDAHIKIILDNCYHSVQLCCYQTQNAKMLGLAIDQIIKNNEWQSLNPNLLFNFARTAIFIDQDKGDMFISKVYQLYNSKNFPVSEPIGLLCNRYERRQKLLTSVSKLPNIANRKLNIAICISGQLRGYKGNLKSLVNYMNLDSHDYRVFIHTWRNIGRKFPVALHAARVFSGEFLKTYYTCFINKSNLQEYIKNQYPNFYSLLLNASVATYNELKDEYNTADIIIDDEDNEPFLSWDNQVKMHYKIYASHKLALNSKEKFDLIIRIRPDIKCEGERPIDLHEIYNQSKHNASIFITGLNNAYWCSDYIILDGFAIGVPEAMDIYANTFLDFNTHVHNNTFSRSKRFVGHGTLEHNLFCNGVHVDKLKFTRQFKDPEMIPIKKIYNALCQDAVNTSVGDEFQQLLGACKRDIWSL